MNKSLYSCIRLVEMAALCLSALWAQPQATTIAGRPLITTGAAATSVPLPSLGTNPNLDTQLKADAAGNAYFATNLAIYQISGQTGVISRVFGSGACDASPYPGDGSPALQITMCDNPAGVTLAGNHAFTLDSSGRLYVLASGRILSVQNGMVKTVAGNGVLGTGGTDGDGGNPLNAQFKLPTTLTVDHSGTVYIADDLGTRVRRIANGQISTFATCCEVFSMTTDSSGYVYLGGLDPLLGSYIYSYTASGAGPYWFAGANGTGASSPDGTVATKAILPEPLLIDDGPDGIYFLDNGHLRQVSSSGALATPQLNLGAYNLNAFGFNPAGAIYFFDTLSSRILKLANGSVTPVAGNGSALGPLPLLQNADPLSVPLSGSGVAVDTQGNLYMNDSATILELNSATGKLSTIAGIPGFPAPGRDGANALAVSIQPVAIAVGPDNDLYFMEAGRLRVLQNGGVKTIATGSAFGYQDMNFDAAGNLWIGDPAANSSSIGKVDLSSGKYTPVLGSVSADSVVATSKGAVYFAQYQYLDMVAGTKGAVFAGSGQLAPYNDNVPAASANISPNRLAIDQQDNLYFSESFNSAIREISAATGVISTVAGGPVSGYSGPSGPASTMLLAQPGKIAFDGAGNLYIADLNNGRIVKVQIATGPVLSIVSGNGAQMVQNSSLALSVAAHLPDGTALAGTTVSFSVISGAATLVQASAATGNAGSAQVTLTSGLTTGPVVVTASAPGTLPVQFRVEIIPLPPPLISDGGVVGGGLSSPLVTTLAPGSIATVFGQYFIVNGTSRALTSADLTNYTGPSQLGNVCVLVGGQPSLIYSIFPTQINFQVPNLMPGSYQVQVITSCDTEGSLFSNLVTINVASAAPEFLYLFDGSDGGRNILAIKQDGTYVGPPGAVPGLNTQPAAAGDVLTIYALGLGPTNPAVTPGFLATAPAAVTANVTLTIGAVSAPSSNVLYVGVVPGYAGLYQVNLIWPAGIPSGSAPVTLSLQLSGGAVSSPKAVLAAM